MLPKSARLFLLAAILASESAHGAPVLSAPGRGSGACPGGRIANAFDAAAFVSCRSVTGDLTIEGTDLSDLSALSELRSVTGALTIRENTALRSLDGLEHLERAGSLSLRANGLYGTRGVERLRQVGTLVIENNRFLISLRGFRNLERADALRVTHNPRLCGHFGLFPALVHVEHGLAVGSNSGLSRDDVASLLARGTGGRP
jgi:hypothetical protein